MPIRQQQEWLTPGPPSSPDLYQATMFSANQPNSSKAAALTVVVWDALLTLEDEVAHIWPKPRWMYVKWLYFLTKWFGLGTQIGAYIFLCFIKAHFPVPICTCQNFYIYGGVCFQFLQLCLDAIMILRIWAVQLRNRFYYVATAFVFVVLQITTFIVAMSVANYSVDAACLVSRSSPLTICLGIGMMVSQSVLIYLTCRAKRLLEPVARRSRIVSVVVRDGILVFGIMIGIALLFSLYLLLNKMVVNVFFPWMTVIPSLSAPRIILNMQKVAEPRESMILELTTDLGSVSYWDDDTHLMTANEAPVIYEQQRDSS